MSKNCIEKCARAGYEDRQQKMKKWMAPLVQDGMRMFQLSMLNLYQGKQALADYLESADTRKKLEVVLKGMVAEASDLGKDEMAYLSCTMKCPSVNEQLLDSIRILQSVGKIVNDAEIRKSMSELLSLMEKLSEVLSAIPLPKGDSKGDGECVKLCKKNAVKSGKVMEAAMSEAFGKVMLQLSPDVGALRSKNPARMLDKTAEMLDQPNTLGVVRDALSGVVKKAKSVHADMLDEQKCYVKCPDSRARREMINEARIVRGLIRIVRDPELNRLVVKLGDALEKRREVVVQMLPKSKPKRSSRRMASRR